jgi:hypothetical protein
MSDIFGGPPEDEEFEGGFDPFGYPEDYAEVEDPYGFWHGETPESWWSNDLTLENPNGESITMEAGEWYEATLNNDEINQAFYGMDTLDIIDDLIDLGLWEDEDWETWREQYGEG